MVRDAFFTPRARCAFVYGVYGTYTCAGSVTVLSKRYVLLMVSWHCTVQDKLLFRPSFLLRYDWYTLALRLRGPRNRNRHRAAYAKRGRRTSTPCTPRDRLKFSKIQSSDLGFPQPIGTPQLTWSSALRFGTKRRGDDEHPRAIERCLRPRHLPHQQRIGAMLACERQLHASKLGPRACASSRPRPRRVARCIGMGGEMSASKY